MMTEENVHTTILHPLHLQYGARMVPFAAYAMPVQYPLGIKQEHLHTRARASLFDVSHMGQIVIRGDAVVEKLEALVPTDLQALAENHSCYTVLTNDKAGIIDDIIVSKFADEVRIVVNAAGKQTNFHYLREKCGSRCSVHRLSAHALLALQGPQAAVILSSLIAGVEQLAFMDIQAFSYAGQPLLVSRSGYTGEDGFEISLPDSVAEDFSRQLLAIDEVELAGLGARDSLRLEAGLCLYGQELSASISPVEANLNWLIGKKYRHNAGMNAPFPGAEMILRQLKEGADKLRVGLSVTGKIPVRAGASVRDVTGQVVGQVTSGGYAPTLGKPIAMAYVNADQAKTGTTLYTEVRSKQIDLQRLSLPFVPHRYYQP